MIEETLQLLRASISANIEIMVSISATSDTVVADAVEIQQILMNLATNAALAMKERGGTLDIGLCDADLEAGPGMHPREHLQLVVKDTGTGMGSDVLEKIFDPFFTTRDRDKGTGMGLSVVYGIVQSLHGIITVESEPGHGSVFRVNLPKAADLPGRDATSNLVLEGAERILFVDDEEALVEWARAALIRHGYTVTATSSPREALKIFASNPLQYDLIITDQAMPGMTGIQLSKMLLSLRPDVPIILCTGHSDSLTTETMKESGIREFLVKPVLRQELVKTIHQVVKGPVPPPASPV